MHVENMKELGRKAKAAARLMAVTESSRKNKALAAIQKQIKKEESNILIANQEDINEAEAKKLDPALLDRLSLENRIKGILEEIESIIDLPDPIGESFEGQVLPNQLQTSKIRVPIGVIGVIYESRPNVTLDISALAIKSGNCVLLRGGSETLRTNRVLTEIVQRSLEDEGFPKEAVQLINSADRGLVAEMLQMDDLIDLIIPRGGAALQRFCKQQSTIPVITGGVGVCHLFVDATADLEKSIQVVLNAKTQRPTVCNALDTLLVHAESAPLFLPKLIAALSKEGVSFKLDARSSQFVQGPFCSLAEESDWDKEWLRLVLGVKVVENIEEAIEHIHLHGTGHSDGILTESPSSIELFIKSIDSAVLYVNASTRFTDGGQLGLGAEVAISTQKFHARGPLGLRELTSYKWLVRGDYQIRK
jgi:glutamate-5-semialdehyde dehydrogenase